MDKTENKPKKDYCSSMHTTEHILNQTMIKMFGSSRSYNAHIEAKKSKCDYHLDAQPTPEQLVELEQQVNEVISRNLDVTERFVLRSEATSIVDLSKLPSDAGDTLRIIDVGNYDSCACIGNHVQNTAEIGLFSIISHNFSDNRWRVRWKVG